MPSITKVASLDWPTEKEREPTTTIHCAGQSFWDYHLRSSNRRLFRHGSSFQQTDEQDDDDTSESTDSSSAVKSSINLLTISQQELEAFTYYQVLGDLPLHATAEQVKRAYHKACLRYHPDKTGRGEDDVVFLKVKKAFDTLSNVEQRKQYDSTHLSFDDSIPREGIMAASEFYKTYGPVFERNLRFDARLLQDNKDSSSNSKSKRKKQQRKSTGAATGPPMLLGNDDTPIDQVHAFYEYWTHFESWRDFTLQAAKAQDEHYDPDAFDSRYEKRHRQKEIDKKAKALKRDEMARINLLVERSMAADPRLSRERQRLADEKQRLVEERAAKERAVLEAKRAKQQEEEREAAQRLEEEKARKSLEKASKEREKKMLRKARQSFRKLAMEAWQQQQQETVSSAAASNGTATKQSMEDMDDNVEFLCQHLDAVQLSELSNELSVGRAPSPSTDHDEAAAGNPERLSVILDKVASVKQIHSNEQELANQRRRDARDKQKQQRKLQQQQQRASCPWSREEMAALAKGVRKYPAGGSNRWETIALFVNNVCKLENPRTKEECIEKYNQLAQKQASPQASTNTSRTSKSAATAVTANSSDGGGGDDESWTDAQVKALQAGLARYPATMDKNERWTAIAKCVNGKSKKECVGKFKAIRQALKTQQVPASKG